MTNQVAATPPASSPDTRARLVEAARYLFWERGFANTGLSDILARAGANSGSFYHFFESKDALLRTVLDTYVEAIEPMLLAPVRAESRTPLDFVMGLLVSYRGRLQDTDCTYGCPIGRLALEIDAENLPAHERIARNFDAWRGAVASAVRQAGLAHPDDVATFVLAVMEGAVMQSRAHRSLAPYDACLRQVAAYLALQPRATKARTAASRRSRKGSRR